jgi:hypothetical protein
MCSITGLCSTWKPGAQAFPQLEVGGHCDGGAVCAPWQQSAVPVPTSWLSVLQHMLLQGTSGAFCNLPDSTGMSIAITPVVFCPHRCVLISW